MPNYNWRYTQNLENHYFTNCKHQHPFFMGTFWILFFWEQSYSARKHKRKQSKQLSKLFFSLKFFEKRKGYRRETVSWKSRTRQKIAGLLHNYWENSRQSHGTRKGISCYSLKRGNGFAHRQTSQRKTIHCGKYYRVYFQKISQKVSPLNSHSIDSPKASSMLAKRFISSKNWGCGFKNVRRHRIKPEKRI